LEKLKFSPDRCKGCGLCVHFCPRGIIRMSDGINKLGHHPAEVEDETECNSCATCARVCPDLVIEVFKVG